MRIAKQDVPWMMAAGRALLGPVLVAGAKCEWNGMALAGLIVTALLSDIFDGVLARRWGCDTAGVRLFDSMADTFFYVCVGAAVWVGRPMVWASFGTPVLLLVGLEAARIAIDMAKFGKPASYHSYLAKTWGLVLAAAIVGVFATGHAVPLLWAAMALGLACNVEGLAMSAMLPVWRRDVKTLRAAWRLRRELGGVRQNVGAARAAVGCGVLLLALSCALPVFAMKPGEALYKGGTQTALAMNSHGTLSMADAKTLVFRADGAIAISITVPYEKIQIFRYENKVKHHLGFFPAMIVGMFMPRQRDHLFTILYTDADGTAQALELDVPKTDARLLSDVLGQRAAGCRVRGAGCGARFGD